MSEFKVRDVKAAPLIIATHEDMGLCYVTKFKIGLKTLYSVVSQQDNPGNWAELRIEQAKKDLLEHGYSWDGVL